MIHDGPACQGHSGDSTCRAIAIATQMPYDYVYHLLNENAKHQRITKRQPSRGSARTGVYKATIRRIMGRLVVSVSKHMVAVVDGVIIDTQDPSRGGTLCIYGYWSMRRASR